MDNITLNEYEEAKKDIRVKQTQKKRPILKNSFDENAYLYPQRRVDVTDMVQLGSKVLIGGGVGLLAGVATIAVAASAAEIVVAGVVTKVAGVIGGAAGLSLGVNQLKKKNTRSEYDI
ncbi:magnetosome protein Mad8 [Candidatus Magnetomorum sp. HK-1]|nr:magnetosome protein Mad8 [Candidatus Magnetomorum sp. HK-1]